MWQPPHRAGTVGGLRNHDFPHIRRFAQSAAESGGSQEQEVQIGREFGNKIRERADGLGDPTGARPDITAIDGDNGSAAVISLCHLFSTPTAQHCHAGAPPLPSQGVPKQDGAACPCP